MFVSFKVINKIIRMSIFRILKTSRYYVIHVNKLILYNTADNRPYFVGDKTFEDLVKPFGIS